VDDWIGAILQALSDTGRLNNTLIVFMSDNGLLLGEHRYWKWKTMPYEESIRVPFIVRWDAAGWSVPRADRNHLVERQHAIQEARHDPGLVRSLRVQVRGVHVCALQDRLGAAQVVPYRRHIAGDDIAPRGKHLGQREPIDDDIISLSHREAPSS
jgi:hypothetical protein